MDVEVLRNGTRVYIDDNVRFGFDALILSRFAITRRTGKILDLGAGCGIISLASIDNGLGNQFTLVDIDENAVLLAEKGAQEYRETRRNPYPIDVHKQDLKTFSASYKYDVVVCNPPYFTTNSGKLNKDIMTRVARHELRCTIADVAFAAKRNLKQGGSLCISYRPNRLVDAITAMRENRLEPKRLRFVRKNHECDPWLVLIDARLDGGVGLQVMRDLLVEGNVNGFSAELAEILG